jgi:hypothetical protein
MSNSLDSATSDDSVAGLLRDVSEMLSFDGYELLVSASASELEVDIAAGPDACEDCLVPKPLMEQIIREALAKGDPTWLDSPIVVRYPADLDR